jgi:P27 family predicted phage terminase small subunit
MSKKQGVNLHVIEGGHGEPPEPDWSRLYVKNANLEREQAGEYWAEIVGAMREAGTLSVVNGHAIKRLCCFLVLYEKAQKDVATEGATLRYKRSNLPYTNPNLIVMRQLDETIRSLESELCLPPLRRGRAGKVTRKPTKPRPADAWLGPRRP